MYMLCTVRETKSLAESKKKRKPTSGSTSEILFPLNCAGFSAATFIEILHAIHCMWLHSARGVWFLTNIVFCLNCPSHITLSRQADHLSSFNKSALVNVEYSLRSGFWVKYCPVLTWKWECQVLDCSVIFQNLYLNPCKDMEQRSPPR